MDEANLMFIFKKRWQLILIAMLILILLPISFASDIDDNATEVGIDDTSNEILTSEDEDFTISVEETDIVIDEGDDVEIRGTVYLFDGIEYFDQLNLQYEYTDSNGVNQVNQISYMQDYSQQGFSFTIKDLTYSNSPYVIKISVIEDEYYDDFLMYGDSLEPVYVNVEVLSSLDPEPTVPVYETFTPAGQLYVSAEDGNDSNDGSEIAPFATIQKALDQNKALGGNYEVIVRSGNYTFDEYYTISNNVSIIGRGKVKITNDGSRYIFFLSGPNTIEFKNLTITDGQYGAISSSATVNGLGEYINEGKVLNIINCTFEENYGDFAVIKSYSKTTILNSTFRNNYAVGSQNEFSGLITLPDGSLTINYCNFYDNNVRENTSLIYAAKRSDANFNFWGTNEGPAATDINGNVKVKTWIGVLLEMDDGEIRRNENYTLKISSKYTNSTGIFKSLEYVMPKMDLTLKTNVGKANPSEIVMSNNGVAVTYNSSHRGHEKVSAYLGETELSYVTFDVKATLGDRIYVSLDGNDDNLGDQLEPVRTIAEALNRNTEFGGNKTIYILEGTYYEDILEFTDSVSVIGNNTTIYGNVISISDDLEVTDVKFLNYDLISHISGNLSIYNSSFENCNNAIASQSNGVLNIYNSTFINNEIAIQSECESMIDNVTFINNVDSISFSSSGTVVNSTFINNNGVSIKVLTNQSVIIENNIFTSNEEAIHVFNALSTVIVNNTFEKTSKPAISTLNSNLSVIDNVFIDNEDYVLNATSSNVDLKNNTVSGLKAINIENSTISNVIIVFLNNETVKAQDGLIQINATVSDDMGNAINGGELLFDTIGKANVTDGKAIIFNTYDDGDYVITGSGDNFPDATIRDGLLRINVKNYWFIGETGYETLLEAINDAEVDDVIEGVPGVYEYEQINIGHRTRPAEPWVINKQITITSLTDDPITLKALGENIFDIDYYSNVTVKNIIFMNANNPDGWGGAIYSMGKNRIVVDNCTFRDNFAYDGAGIHAWGDLYIKDSLFIDNVAGVYGGAVFKDGDGNLVVENTKFINNSAYTYAGAVYTMGYNEINQLFKNVTFEGNDATCGGAFFTMGKNVTLIDCNFTNNKAVDKESGYDPLGGAVYVHNGATNFTNVRFVNNTAEGNGGALELNNGATSTVDSSGRHIDVHWAILDNCLIENNTATGFGGAIYTDEIRTSVNITNTIIKNNKASNAALYVNIFGFYTLDNVTVENNKNTAGDLLIYSYGEYSFPESFYANDTIINSVFKNNSADIVVCAVSEYVTINITDSMFDTNGILLESTLSRVYLTNLLELNPTGNYSVNSSGNLSLKNNTFENPILNNGNIDTPTVVVIIGNETRYENVGETVIDAIVMDDNNNSIIGGNLVFFVNNQLILSILDNVTFKANYTVIPSNQTINAVYDDIGLLDITNKYGIIIGRIIPTIDVEDTEFNISGEFKAILSNDGVPIPNEDLILEVDGNTYVLTTDENGVATAILELPFGKYVANVKFNGNELYSLAEAQANITVNKLASSITLDVNDIKIYETAIINMTLPENATGNVVVTVGERDYLVKINDGNAILTLPNLDLGEYIVIADYYGDEKYLNSSASALLKVTTIDEGMTVESNDTNIKVALPDDAKGNVLVFVDGKEMSNVTVQNGEADVKLDDLSPGAHLVEVKYTGDGKYSSDSYITAIYVPEEQPVIPTPVVRKDTHIVVDATFTRVATDYFAGERGANHTAYLVDEDGNPVFNKTVQIAVNGAIYNLTTDKNGAIHLQINLNTAMIYTYALSFKGDDEYQGSPIASSKLTVTKKKTSISATKKTFKAKTKTKTISVTLKTIKNKYNGKTYLKKGKKLTLKINGKTYTAKTNAKGIAKFKIKLTKKGKYTAKIKFAGDKTYKASSKSIKVTIK